MDLVRGLSLWSCRHYSSTVLRFWCLLILYLLDNFCVWLLTFYFLKTIFKEICIFRRWVRPSWYCFLPFFSGIYSFQLNWYFLTFSGAFWIFAGALKIGLEAPQFLHLQAAPNFCGCSLLCFCCYFPFWLGSTCRWFVSGCSLSLSRLVSSGSFTEDIQHRIIVACWASIYWMERLN